MCASVYVGETLATFNCVAIFSPPPELSQSQDICQLCTFSGKRMRWFKLIDSFARAAKMTTGRKQIRVSLLCCIICLQQYNKSKPEEPKHNFCLCCRKHREALIAPLRDKSKILFLGERCSFNTRVWFFPFKECRGSGHRCCGSHVFTGIVWDEAFAGSIIPQGW